MLANHLPRPACLAIAAAVTTLALAGCGESEVNTGMPPKESATATSIIEADSITDTTKLRNLLAISTHVFTGRVESTAGTKALGAIPETQYSVSTGTALKGDVPQTVTVNQQGGTSEDGAYISLNSDAPLKVGQWYLFATRYLDTENWYTVIPVNGHRPITEQQARDKTAQPVAEALAEVKANPQNRFAPADPPPPPLTFPVPRPGDKTQPPPHSPPPSIPQPR